MPWLFHIREARSMNTMFLESAFYAMEMSIEASLREMSSSNLRQMATILDNEHNLYTLFFQLEFCIDI